MTNSQAAQSSTKAQMPVLDAESISISSSNNRNVSREDIQLVQNLIERCLQAYMNKEETIRMLSNCAKIDPGLTTLVWQKLEEENSEFFRSYYIRMKLKEQIILLNNLLQHQAHLMNHPVLPNVPLVPLQSGMCSMPVDNLSMGYPMLQQPPMPATGQPLPDSMGTSSCHVANEIPAPASFHPMLMHSGDNLVMNNGIPEVAPAAPQGNAVSNVPEMNLCPTSVAPSNDFLFSPSEITGMGLDSTALYTTFPADGVDAEELQLRSDGGIGSSRDSVGSFGQLWNFSSPDLTAELANLGDLGAFEDYDDSTLLPLDPNVLLNSPELDDIAFEEYFADTMNAPSTRSDGGNP